MPKDRLHVPYTDFTGGVNEDDQPGALATNELRIARNIVYKGRALSSRAGSSRPQTVALNSGAAGTSVYNYTYTAGANQIILATFGNAIYSGAKGATPTAITGTATVTAGQNTQVHWVTVNDTALGCNGTDPPWVVDAAANAAVLGGSPPSFGTMATKWNYTFGAGHAAATRTIRYSAMGSTISWPSANTVSALLGDSSPAIEGRDYIWQLSHLGDSLFVGLANSVGRVLYTGDSTTPFRYQQLSDFGIEGQSYVPVGAGGYFLSKRGVHFIQPSDVQLSYESSLISGQRLRATWDGLNKARIRYTYPTLYRTSVGNLLVIWPLSSGGATTIDMALVMDVTEGPGRERFFWWTGWDANALCTSLNSSSKAEELLFASSVGYVWQGDTDTSDNDVAYVVEAATRWEDFGAPSVKKLIRAIYVELKQSGAFSLNIGVYFDYSTTEALTLTQSVACTTQAVWGTAVWGTDVWPTLGIVRSYLPGFDDGVVISFRFYTTAADQPWSVYKCVPAVRAATEAKD